MAKIEKVSRAKFLDVCLTVYRGTELFDCEYGITAIMIVDDLTDILNYWETSGIVRPQAKYPTDKVIMYYVEATKRIELDYSRKGQSIDCGSRLELIADIFRTTPETVRRMLRLASKRGLY